jgi:hypothetical protein
MTPILLAIVTMRLAMPEKETLLVTGLAFYKAPPRACVCSWDAFVCRNLTVLYEKIPVVTP